MNPIRARRDRLLHEHVDPGRQGLPGNREMACWWGTDEDGVGPAMKTFAEAMHSMNLRGEGRLSEPPLVDIPHQDLVAKRRKIPTVTCAHGARADDEEPHQAALARAGPPTVGAGCSNTWNRIRCPGMFSG